jgi:alpha-amylase
MMYELDYKPVAKNLLDTMTRRQEGYHKKLNDAVAPGGTTPKTASIHDLVLAKEPDLVSKLHFDFYERKSFIDHFLNDNTTLESFATAHYGENGDFIDQPYKVRSKKMTSLKAEVNLQREGKVWYRGKHEPVRVEKKIECSNTNGQITARYTVVNDSKIPLNLWFGVEFNFGLQAGHAEDRYYYVNSGEIGDKFLDSIGEQREARFIGLRDDWRGLDIQLDLSESGTIWRFPIETISLSEAGFERVYQSSALLPNWKFELKHKWQVAVTLKFGSEKNQKKRK